MTYMYIAIFILGFIYDVFQIIMIIKCARGLYMDSHCIVCLVVYV